MVEESIIVNNISKSFKLKRTKSVLEHLKDISKNSGNNLVHSLEDVSFSVKKGEMLGVIGLNGSGKTTLLRIISGVYKPDSGSVKVHGKMAPLLQIGTGFHPELNSQENIMMYGLLLGLKKEEIKSKIPAILEFAELQEFTEMKLKNYSTGMRARLGFSTALQVDPEILLVDEVLAVGDAAFKEKSSKAFLSFKERGKTIVYTTHNIGSVSELSDRVLLLDKGKVVMIGKPDEVVAKYNEIVKERQSRSVKK